ncbi:glycosyltransferase family 4 protein [Dehalococcoidia bacterium]|nr:glycosyltransferase family 4 protein [Dehalococcoidia bacterium]MCL0090053.1 glycosyltransferase family 4 protein [Dehalococcoidia bacterium]
MQRTQEKTLLLVYPFGDALDPKGGGAQNRIFNIATQLSKKNNIIILEPEWFLTDKEGYSRLKIYGFNSYIPPFLTDLNLDFHFRLYRILRKKKIDIIQITFPAGIISAKIITKLLRLKVPVVYDAQSVAGIIIKNTTNPELPFYKRIGGLICIPLLERFAVKFADHITSVSHEDKDLFVKAYSVNPAKITVIPSGTNILNPNFVEERRKVRKELDIEPRDIIVIFHGIYTYTPNKEAIDLIISYIAPKIGQLYGNVKFIIAGKDVPRFEENHIKSLGFVEDIYSLLNVADIAIVPLLRGGGTKLKIFDYMGAGKPIVTTKKGMEGIEAEDGEHAIIVDNVDEEFINAIKYLIENKHERERLGRSARKLAEEKYEWNKIGENLDKLYKNLSNKRASSKSRNLSP